MLHASVSARLGMVAVLRNGTCGEACIVVSRREYISTDIRVSPISPTKKSICTKGMMSLSDVASLTTTHSDSYDELILGSDLQLFRDYFV